MIQVGRYQISSIVTGELRLDGGAMFGVVPKVLWQNLNDVDDSNRILLVTRSLLAVDRTSHRVLLVDTGCGSKWKAADAERYGIRPDAAAIDRALAAHGLQRGDVTDVVVTHLHFDHNGGLTDWTEEPGGETRIRYPQATHWLHVRHWQHAQNPTVRDRASFVRSDFEGLRNAGSLRLIDGDAPAGEIDGIRWFVSNGHTPFQLLPIFESDDGGLMFASDIVPTIAHLRLGWVMAYDLFPLTTVAEREQIYARCLSQGTRLAFPHDPRHGIARLTGSIERPVVIETLD